MTTVLEVLHKRAEPYKVTLTRGQKGTYGWEITVSAASINECEALLRTADNMLKETFGGGDVHAG